MKKIFSLFLAGVIMVGSLLSLVSCSNDKDIIEIEFYQQNEADVELFEHIIKDFEQKYPHIRVKQVNIPEEESASVLMSRIQNNDTPDIFNEWFGSDVFALIENGVLRDLKGSDLCKYVDETALEQVSYNGKYCLIPMTKNFMGVYYNVGLFEKHNIAIPTTIDEFWDVCETFKSLGITPISAGDKDGWNLAHWTQDVMGTYMPNYSEEFLKIYSNEMQVKDMNGISDFADIIVNRSKYVQSGSLGADSDAMISMFVNQETAMLINGSWWMGTLNSANLEFEYAVFPFPGRTAEETKVMSNADYSFVLSSTSSDEKKKAAETFLEYILSDGAKYYIEQTGSPSALKNIVADSSRYKLLMPYLDGGKVFRMPQSGRWGGSAYLDYTVAVQNLTDSGNKEAFFKEFEDALKKSGKPQYYAE